MAECRPETEAHSFILPAITGMGENFFKYRTADGRYCEGPLSITLTAPPEPEPEPTLQTVKLMKSTVIATPEAGKLLHVTHDYNAFSQIAVGEGETATITTKKRTDTGYYGEISGTVTLRKL